MPAEDLSAAILWDTGSGGVICAPDYTHIMEYDWWLAGPDGASFTLFPLRGVHTSDQIKRAKRALQDARDVVTIGIKRRPKNYYAKRTWKNGRSIDG